MFMETPAPSLMRLGLCAISLVVAGCGAPTQRSASVQDCGVLDSGYKLASESGALGFGPAPQYVGLSVNAGRSLAARGGKSLRVVGQDGKCFVVAADASNARVSVYLLDDRIRAAAVE
jgi:hypothetical protein